MHKFKIIGLGGIGSWLAEPLARFLNYSDDPSEVMLIDGDVYEEKNEARQSFSEKGNKAAHTASVLRQRFPKVHFRSKAEYVTNQNILSSIREGDVVFLCVDNHATRKLTSLRCKQLSNVVLISGGNDYTDGNVIVYIRQQGKDVTKAPTDLFPSIADPQDENPGEKVVDREGCEQEAQSAPQLLFTNLAIASCMLNCYYAYKQDKVNFEQVYVDIVAQKMRPSPEPEINF